MPRAANTACYRPRVKLSVVIPALDEVQQIAGAIESATYGDVEVLVIDGGSRDGTRERALSAGARVIDATRGRARQMAAPEALC